MNMIQAFNQTMNYLETVLADEIDEKKLQQLSGYSPAMFSRLFSIMTDMTLSEYLRQRRLTEAAIELREGTAKIIDIAVKYGYETPDSFGGAFKKFHGFSPSQVRAGKQFRIVSRIQLALSIRGGKTMNITIEKKPAFTVTGMERANIDSQLCPEIWRELFAKCPPEQLARLGSGQSFGICHDVKNPAIINYMAAYDVKDLAKAKELGLTVLEIEAAEYAVAELQGSVPQCIHEGWKYLMEVFFPEQGYVHSGQPDFEVYSEGDMGAEDYQMQLWVPIEKAV